MLNTLVAVQCFFSLVAYCFYTLSLLPSVSTSLCDYLSLSLPVCLSFFVFFVRSSLLLLYSLSLSLVISPLCVSPSLCLIICLPSLSVCYYFVPLIFIAFILSVCLSRSLSLSVCLSVCLSVSHTHTHTITLLICNFKMYNSYTICHDHVRTCV